MERANVHNWGVLLSEEQLEEIEQLAKNLEMREGTIGADNRQAEDTIRRNKTGWFNKKEHKRIFELGEQIVAMANRYLYSIDTSGGVPEIQYSTYEVGDHYNWHVDVNWEDPYMYDRKISIVIILSDPEEYEGGALRFKLGVGGLPFEDNPPKGTVITFPSYLRHKVEPITKGNRTSIVMWAEGPRFK